MKNFLKILLSALFIFFIVTFFIVDKKDGQLDDKGQGQTQTEQKDSKQDEPKENEPKEEPKPEEPKEEEPKEEPKEETPKKGESFVRNITGISINEKKKKVIIEYMDLYYRSIKDLKVYDMSSLFANENARKKNEAAISLLIETRKLKKNDLHLTEAYYDLNFTSDDGVVKVLEDSYIKFAFMDSMSKVYNIKSEFTLVSVNGEYKISKYDRVQDFYVMFTDGNYETVKNNYLKMVKKNLQTGEQEYNDYLNNKVTPKKCDNGYDRKKALEYALKWVDKRNSAWPKYSSNCQNYASQVVYSGGVPMDYYGSASKHLQWKSYSSSLNEKETASGLVYTWTYVPYFATYAKNNTGYGLCARVDENLYYAEAGDVIHVGTNGPTRHALVVVGTVKKDGKVIDVLVNSNTIDLENYPISAYSYPYLSLIKVYGWNN